MDPAIRPQPTIATRYMTGLLWLSFWWAWYTERAGGQVIAALASEMEGTILRASGPKESEMLSSIHILLTYQCNIGCDHCFLFCGPHARGVFTAADLRRALDQIAQVPAITAVCFEGGEPTLYYPLLLEGLRLARERGLKTSIVTNTYWATTEADAALWIAPMVELGMSAMSVSDDALHFGSVEETPAKRAMAAAKRLGLAASAICTERPRVVEEGGERKVTGGVMFRGRAAGLVEELPRRAWERFTACPHEKLANPSRVHLDPYGNLHLCQGVLLGNLWETPLAELLAGYDPQAHPIAGPLLRGGPSALIAEHGLPHEEGYVDACHLCYAARLALLERYPAWLGPRQVYGLG